MKAVLVFGGTGFLGRYLVKFLLSKNFKVIVYKHRRVGFLSDVVSEDLIIIDSFDEKLLKTYEVVTVFHLASMVFSHNSEYEDFYQSNVSFTKEVIEISKFLDVSQFIYVSTGSVLSKNINTPIIDEFSCPDPNNFYGLTKYIAEKLVEIEMAKTDIKTCIVRFPSIFGLHSGGGIVDTIYKLSKEDSDIEVYSCGQRLRNLIHVDSAASMLALLHENYQKLDKHELFMSGSENSLKLIEIAKLLIKLTGSKSNIIPVHISPASDFDVIIDTTKAKNLIGFKPITIEDGLKKYVKDMENENL